MEKIGPFLRQAGIGALSLHELGTGGNNRVFRVESERGRFALKHYFSHPGDRRDRCGAEVEFLRHLERAGVEDVPKVLAVHANDRLALFTWVEGQRPTAVSAEQVSQAGRLFSRMNRARESARTLPLASEASFSIVDALELVARRLGSLMSLSRANALDREAANLADEMTGLWPAVKARAYQQAGEAGLDPDEEVHASQRCLSPSDFGFHNALQTQAGELRFVDFEYAGWDDPAKMAADFFCQPEVAVSMDFWDVFMAEAFTEFADAANITARARILLPAFQLRWCAIALNLFQPVSLARRQFSRPALEEDQSKQRQLKIAQSLFQRTAV
ncbi:MAG: phosphotransferase [Burkholderiales bacterium]